MSRNEMDRFSMNPTNIDISRSTFNRDFSSKTTGNVGEVIPICSPIEILPGDSISIDTSMVIRMQPMVAPIMDSLYCDTYWFYCPSRLLWNHFVNFMGECKVSPWDDEIEYTIPQLSFPDNGFEKGTIADHFGLPINVATNETVSALPFRAYAKIIDDWFKDGNIMNPIHISVDDSNIQGSNGSDQVTDIEKGGHPFIACRTSDYFSRSLPQPQRGDPVVVNTGTIAPVFPNDIVRDSSLYGVDWLKQIGSTGNSLLSESIGSKFSGTAGTTLRYNDKNDSPLGYAKTYSANRRLGVDSTGDSEMSFGNSVENFTPGTGPDMAPIISNYSALITDYSGFTINELRQSFAVQKFLEASARSGNRYIELLRGIFGVTSPDARLQRSEYLGGSRTPISISQVTQTSKDDAGSYLGDVAGQSFTADSNHDVFKSFTEHGYVIGLMVVRYDASYSEGIERFWSRKNKFQFYFPQFANLGEMPIFKKELFLTNDDVLNNEVFAYQEAWADYRFPKNQISGEFRSAYATPLDSWHLGDHYTSTPSLSPEWLRVSKAPVDRCLNVTSNVSDQFIADFYIESKMTRPMPLYSIPGLIDHH